MTEQPVQQIDNDEISLKELIQKIQEWVAYLKTQWKLIIGIAAVGAIIGFVYASFQKPSYKAVLTFVLDDAQGGGSMGGAIGLASSFGFDLGGGGGGLFSNSNIIELMKSRLVIEKTLLNAVPYNINGKNENISLAEYYIRINKMRDAWMVKSKLKNIDFSPNTDRTKYTLEQDSILEQISSTIVGNILKIAQPDKKSSFNTIEVTSNDELFSKLFCEQLAKEITTFYIETKSKKAKTSVVILERQVDSIRKELNSSIIGVASEMDNVFNLNSAMTSRASPSKTRQIDVQANTSVLTQLVGQLELARVSLRKETPLIQIIDKPILPLRKEKLSRIKSLVLGGGLAGFLSVFFLILVRLYKNLIA